MTRTFKARTTDALAMSREPKRGRTAYGDALSALTERRATLEQYRVAQVGYRMHGRESHIEAVMTLLAEWWAACPASSEVVE